MDDLERGALLVQREKLEFRVKDLKASLSDIGTDMQQVGVELKEHPDVLANMKSDAAGGRSSVPGHTEWLLPEKAAIAQKLHDLHEACNGLDELNSTLGTP